MDRFPEIMGTAETAEALGVTVQNLRFVSDLPEPIARIRASRIWLAADIREFAEVFRARNHNRRNRQVANVV